MSADAIRSAVMTAVGRAQTAWNASSPAFQLVVEAPNRTVVDLATQTVPYLAVDVVFGDGGQLDLGARPLVCDYGNIALAAGVREGGGESDLLKVLDFVRPYLQLRDDLGPLRTKAAKFQKPITRLGFYYLPMLVPFWAISAAPAAP